MKVMVEGHVTAWCYVDTESGQAELVEVWAWDEELSFEPKPYVIAEDAEIDFDITQEVREKAWRVALDQSDRAPLAVARWREQTRLCGT